MLKKRLSSRLQTLIYLVASFLILALIMSYAIPLVKQKQELSQLQTRMDKLEKEKSALVQEINQLSDDDYIARYARDNYIFAEDGEEVVKLPKTEE